MAYQNQQFFGAINATTIEKENFIIGSGNFASGSERIADFSVIAGDVNLLRVSQSIYSVGGAVPTDTYIKAIDGSIIYLSVTASSNAAGDTIGISTPSGSYLINSASWNDPNNAITVNDISGSDEGQDYAILGVAQRNGAVAKGVFHAYKIKEVVYRDLGTSKLSFFVEWGEEGTEADSGDILRLTEKALAVVNLSDTGSLAPGFSLGISGMENLVAGSEFSGYNIALNQYFSYLSASVPSTASNAERAISASISDELSGLATASFADYATSASIALEALTASIALRAISASQADNANSASVAARATTLSPDATASFADRTTSASIADALSQLATASYALQAESASVAARATTLSPDATASFADRATTASIADELSQLATASFALTASHALNVSNTASHALTAVTASQADRATSASIADELSQLATASFADSATTASYALYAVSASHEIIHEESSSLAETASLAISLSPEATASQADSATTASFALTASHALNVPDTASHALTAVSASIADELSQLATASFADSATSASYAETASYAFSASVEITKEVSSSLADTASFAQSGDGDFSGVFSGSNYSTEFTFEGDTLIVSGNVFVDGTLDAATKNFKIQHPTMEGYYLLHSSLEGPERGIYHRGKLSVSNIIYLPDYWKELPVDETDITVQLTPIGNNCQHWVKRVTKETVEIECECGKPSCFYIIHAQRYNEGKFEILEPKRNKSL